MTGNQRIAERAYGIWEQEGRPHGRDLDHWLSAIAEIEGQNPPSGTGAETVPPRAKSRKAENAAQ